MTESKRRRRFRLRVEYERAVLECINRKDGWPPLHGLTKAAIQDFEGRCAKVDGGPDSGLFEQLRTLARAARSFADRSREIFDPIEFNDDDAKRLLHELNRLALST